MFEIKNQCSRCNLGFVAFMYKISCMQISLTQKKYVHGSSACILWTKIKYYGSSPMILSYVLSYFISKVRKYESTFVRRYVYTYNYCTNNNKHTHTVQLLSIFGSMIPSTCTVRVRTCTTTIHWLLFGSTKVLLYLTIYPVCIQCTRTEDFMEILPCLLYTCTRVRRYDRALTKKTKVYADQKAVFHPHLSADLPI